ncbi:hypothetical protein JAAARDRAFT_351401 [Jaapia argillacea MUCL 33604]|uniref:Uncharacterized protein n=1 Tax=Jaapia argillacea MUCL 33604 TaxID=933084 RepID=A0A067PIW5_9AGAM|nr:hypothetical protein JAAARDRAFT_351401 [Jaapia argillacea MUCL 33604]
MKVSVVPVVAFPWTYCGQDGPQHALQCSSTQLGPRPFPPPWKPLECSSLPTVEVIHDIRGARRQGVSETTADKVVVVAKPEGSSG